MQSKSINSRTHILKVSTQDSDFEICHSLALTKRTMQWNDRPEFYLILWVALEMWRKKERYPRTSRRKEALMIPWFLVKETSIELLSYPVHWLQMVLFWVKMSLVNSKPRKLRHLSQSPSFIGTVTTGETAVALAGLGSLLGNLCSNSNV